VACLLDRNVVTAQYTPACPRANRHPLYQVWYQAWYGLVRPCALRLAPGIPAPQPYNAIRDHKVLLSGTATYVRKPYRLVAVALHDQFGKHVFVLATIFDSKATAKDVWEYEAVVASLRPTS
jgi:hypothetical protein